MTTIAVVPVADALSEPVYHAIAGDKQASGKMMGDALNALTPQLEDDDNAVTLIVLQKSRPDRFFSAAQQQRREELTAQWREAQDADGKFPAALQAELEQLIHAEVRAAGLRAAALLQGAAT